MSFEGAAYQDELWCPCHETFAFREMVLVLILDVQRAWAQGLQWPDW